MADYMGLESIDSSDYVSPTPINNNFKKLDVLGLDYVVEQGTSGEWWYRKWKSGRAECGIDSKSFGDQAMYTQSVGASNMYRTTDLSFGAYPFSFAARPYVEVSFEGDTKSSDRTSFVAKKNSTSTTMSPKFFIVDWAGGNMGAVAGIYVCGRYK